MKPIKDKFILLFTPQPTAEGRRSVPLGLLAISTFLGQEGYDIRILHSYDKDDYLDALNHLDKVIGVGITAMTGYQIYDGLNFARLVREKNSKVPLIWGGVHPTIKPMQTARHPLVDIVVKGQGEETFTELIHKLDNHENYENVLGITFKKNGQIVDNQERPTKSINEFPAIPYHLLDDSIERYIKKNPYAKRNISYITSLGCPFRCAFCYLATETFAQKWDPYPAERVVDEIGNLVKNYRIDGLDIRDANFFVDRERTRAICKGLLAKKIKIAISGVNGRAEQLIQYGPSEWELFKEAGIREILVGAESGDQTMLDLINKKSSVEAILKCERIAKKYDINIIESFMTGFPALTDEKEKSGQGHKIREILKRELNKTVELIFEIFKINPIANILLFFYTPYPGTPLYELSLKNGFKEPKSLEDWARVDLAHQVTPWTTKKHCKKVELLRKVFILKKVTASEYVKNKNDWKFRLLKITKLNQLLNYLVGLRLKYKVYCLPWERLIFAFL